MFTPVSPTPNEAQAFVQPGSAAAGLLPISVTDAKNFSTPADTEAIAGLIFHALNDFAASQQEGTAQVDPTVDHVADNLYIAAEPDEPEFAKYVYYALGGNRVVSISGSATYRVPLAPNQPGPFNPPVTTKLMNQSIGELVNLWTAGKTKLVATVMSGSDEFELAWA